MPKIKQGKYEVLTTKEDAINKFMQLQGVCREKISEENPINFYCSEKGKIVITNPSSNRIRTDGGNATNLFAEVLEEDGKTYVNYYTEFSKANNILKLIFLVIYSLMSIFAIVLAIKLDYKMYYIPILALAILFYGIELFATTKEKKNSPKDSEILIKVLENRVEAVNLWDK